MRTTLNLDDDVYRAAKAVSDLEGVSLGAALSKLARKGLVGGDDRLARSGDGRASRNGVAVLPRGNGVVTPDIIRDIDDGHPV